MMMMMMMMIMMMMMMMCRALLAAGAQCVLVSLWPVPDTAVKLIMKAFYSSLLQGARVSRALSEVSCH